MQQISKREQTLLRIGVIVAILITLWAFGLLRSGPTAVFSVSKLTHYSASGIDTIDPAYYTVADGDG